MAKILTGIQSTGTPHLGNILGAIIPAVEMANSSNEESYLFIANMHSLTQIKDQNILKENTFLTAATWLAFGLDSKKSCFFRQSDVPEVTELAWYLSCFFPYQRLKLAHSFKDKSDNLKDVNSGLFSYPMLMSADILMYDADIVPVGKDQEQHLEMARNFVQRFNHRYGEVFPEPQAFNFGSELVKVPSLDGTGKMSKSENNLATLYLADDDDTIRKKVMKAKTDAGPTAPNTPKPDYIENIFLLMELVSEPATISAFEEAYRGCTIRYGDLKKQLAEDMIRFMAPIREKAALLQKDTSYLEKIMKQGAEKARASAAATMSIVRKSMGLNYY